MSYYNKLNQAVYWISQNFMTKRRLIEKITDLSNINSEDTVIEIGTGKGHLTRVLGEKCGYLYSVEIDKNLFEKSSEKLKNIKNIRLINGDFLEYSLPKKGKYKVFSNIPYSITTRIVDKLTEASNPADEIWLVMEKGTAKRFIGVPRENTKSLLLKSNWNLEIIYYFKKEDFHPKPSVDSVLLHLSHKKNPDVEKKDYIAYKKFTEHSMKHGLFGKNSFLTKKQISTALKEAKLPALHKDGQILYIQWLCLFRCCKKFHRI
ncbi:23S ribosomal RNA methyltransferase Erm [Sedimentibacter sp.]|uniref:23S ribosomal RNA methyltransferase Erm n=1 Tax=Sedimentibacter sp. TaxID=1960295 RepID=UPI0028AFC90D|nr:23S ribosomal RNA methyltransferase Erm [Sedimentibacter sp.]